MKNLIATNINEIEAMSVKNSNGETFYAKPVIPWEDASTCSAAFIEIPVGKSSYSHHWHERSEEIFYIINGEGKLRTFHGDKNVKAGDIICFPSGEKGVHSITNTSSENPLIYIDFATKPKTDIAILPDTNQAMIYGNHVSETILDMPKK
ncbi:MAG: cupin domain-containing protein [Defluviitaleaceae bacterium]|nr:cupin domain-containing protein [Defluviitaleaceae bacterium]